MYMQFASLVVWAQGVQVLPAVSRFVVACNCQLVAGRAHQTITVLVGVRATHR